MSQGFFSAHFNFPLSKMNCLFFLVGFPLLMVSCLNDTEINEINSHPKRPWKAGKSKYKHQKEFKTQLGTNWLDDAEFDKLPKQEIRRSFLRLEPPLQFDARTNWPKCQSIQEIRDQGYCGSCWAHSVAEALSDRICIFSQSKMLYAHVSVQDLMTCCSKCGGCQGGIVEYAYQYFVSNGIVTGGDYGNTSGCQPYSSQSMRGSQTACTQSCSTPRYVGHWHFNATTPRCRKYCTNKRYPKSYAMDAYKGVKGYTVSKLISPGVVTADTERNIQIEIMTKGPISMSIKVYEDFENYQSGVYYHIKGKELGGHAMKCIGWGVDAPTGQKYWLIANSWGTNWGEKGFVRIRRGNNECNVETRANAGEPKQY